MEKVKCISCGYEYEHEEEHYDYEECPNCDFPYKYNDWVEGLKQRISELERENTRLATKLSGAFRD